MKRDVNVPESLSVLETCLYVDELPPAEHFYGTILGLPLVSHQEGRHLFFRCGPAMLLLFRPQQSRDESGEVPPHGSDGPGHVAFSISEPYLDDWRKHLNSHRVPIEQEVCWPNGVRSLYFRDPAGNSLELVAARLWE